MKKIISLIFPIFLLISSQPVFANPAETNEIKIKYDFSAQDMLDNSSAKITSITQFKSKNLKFDLHSLYRQNQASIELIEDEYSFTFPTAEDVRISFKNGKFRGISFHLVDAGTWLPISKIQLQLAQIFKLLNSDSNLILETESSQNLCCPVKLENLQRLSSLRWYSNNFSIHIAVQCSTLPKSVLPRDEDLYRIAIYANSKITPL